ncbi:ScbA/BarX family gamma-butyrolactone biosynthesis protein, partial [Streptomyces sp. NPDC021080]|uniref:ScbA/BarX family gamma-butyrolactone biosynthesis protein n=1 Tax=Streptomyces sp. NPDC021080 TaxID=3365110 RepID=UPI0037B4BEDB
MSLASPRTATPTPEGPGLTTTVPKEYVHRASLAEVFLTGWARQSATRFSLCGQWPRAHTFFQAADGSSHDPLLAAETFRQAGLLLAHTELGVPLGHHFIMWDLAFTTRPDHLHIGPAPTDIELSAVCTDIVFQAGKASRFRMELSIHRDNTTIATGNGRFTCISPGVYQRLRPHRPSPSSPARRPDTTLPPATVGRTRPTDVVLTPTQHPDHWLLTPDPDHPVLFDHHGDHHPGMVLLEAARQAATALTHPHTITPTTLTTTFHHYAELNDDCIITATPTTPPHQNHTTIHITGHQNNQPIFTTHLTTTHPT